NPPFLDAVLPLLADGARFRLATDWAQYAQHMRAQLDPRPALELLHPDGPRPEGDSSDAIPPNMPTTRWAPAVDGRVTTGFEGTGGAAGRSMWGRAHSRVPRRAGAGGTAGIGPSTAACPRCAAPPERDLSGRLRRCRAPRRVGG